MIAQKYRFHGYGALKFVLSKGQTVRSRSVNLRYIENKRRERGRLAVVVSKKTAKRSPVRNKIRRRIYEVVRLQWPMIKPGYDIVISVFDEELASTPPEKLTKLITSLLQEADLIKL